MQQAAPFEAHLSDILIVLVVNRVTGKDRIAMVSVAVNDVAAIGGGSPDIFREEVVLRLFWPVVKPLGIPVVSALNFLKENDIRSQFAQLLAKLMHHHVLMELREALVDVVGDDVQWQIFHGDHDTEKKFPASQGSEARNDLPSCLLAGGFTWRCLGNHSADSSRVRQTCRTPIQAAMLPFPVISIPPSPLPSKIGANDIN
jgi:hypothetical protein